MRMHGSSKEKRRRRLTACLLLVCLLLAGCGKENTVPAEETPAVTETPVKIEGETPILQSSENMGSGHGISVTMLNVGQGLSILVQADGQTLLYDGGPSKPKVCEYYLANHGVDALDYMVVSHYDQDHFQGLSNLLNWRSIKTVLCPGYEPDGKNAQRFVARLTENGHNIVHPKPGDKFALGKAEITVLGPESYEGKNDNDRSLAIMITYGDFCCILTGDAEQEEENYIAGAGIAADADLYVLGHHGSASSSSAALLDVICPEYVFLSCGAGNDYGHPDVGVMTALQQRGAELFRTDVQSIVTCYSNGERVWFSELPCGDWSDGLKIKDEMPTVDDCSYVLNINSMKYHLPKCDKVQEIAKNNCIFTDLSMEKILEMGYKPCSVCKPEG